MPRKGVSNELISDKVEWNKKTHAQTPNKVKRGGVNECQL